MFSFMAEFELNKKVTPNQLEKYENWMICYN